MERLLFIDTETGGIIPERYSLFSIGLTVWEDFQIIDKKEILIKEKTLRFNKKAMLINQIDIEFHKSKALFPSDAFHELDEFLSKNFPPDHKITLVGHNISFDVSFLKQFYLKNRISFHKRFSHRFIDTASILSYLYYAKIIPENISSSTKAFNYFDIIVENRHTALGDAIATSELFSKLITLRF